MVRVNKGLLVGQIFGNEYGNFPKVLNMVSGNSTQKNESENIIIVDGLLIGKVFNREDLQQIKAGEPVECYGIIAAFTRGFTLGFKS